MAKDKNSIGIDILAADGKTAKMIQVKTTAQKKPNREPCLCLC
jgi:hypothetical protein